MGLKQVYCRAENPTTISEWALATFGEASTPQSIAARALVEAAELVQYCVVYDRDRGVSDLSRKIVMECADVYIVICRNATQAGVNIDESIRSELALMNMGWYNGSLAAVASDVAVRLAALCARPLPPFQMFELLGMIGARLELIVRHFGQGELFEFVDQKMEINRARKWKLDGHGHGQHVDED